MGYKVVVGGSGARHPHIADTVTEFTDLEGVRSILEKTIALVRNSAKQPMRVFTLRKLIAETGVDVLKQ
jgi:NAD(P)H-nitrite reductase large subunit